MNRWRNHPPHGTPSLDSKKPELAVEPHYTLQEAVDPFFPGGRITVRSLRTEIKKGRLQVTEVAGKFLVSESAIAEMLERCRQCPAAGTLPTFTSANDADDLLSGRSETERMRSAQAAARTTLQDKLAAPAPITRSAPTAGDHSTGPVLEFGCIADELEHDHAFGFFGAAGAVV